MCNFFNILFNPFYFKNILLNLKLNTCKVGI